MVFSVGLHVFPDNGVDFKVVIDFVRPREGEYEERECATIRFGGQNT